jgi:hypothetical protein
LVNIIKQSTQPRRGKGWTKREREREDPSPSQKHTNPKGVTKGQRSKNYVPKPSPVARSISKKEREKKPGAKE